MWLFEAGADTEDVQNKVLKRIFGHKKKEVTERERKSRNRWLHNFCFSTDITGIINTWAIGLTAEAAGIKGRRNILKNISRET